MQQPVRKLTLANVDEIKDEFCRSLNEIGHSVQGVTGLPLLALIKRERLGIGPYPNVTLFEAANRIMSDLVILHGISGILKARTFPFDEYTVEFGNEDRNGFDICAKSDTATLCGEAFNVAPSFFRTKNAKAIKKLRSKGSGATHRLILFNSDACVPRYVGRDGYINHVSVDIGSGAISVS